MYRRLLACASVLALSACSSAQDPDPEASSPDPVEVVTDDGSNTREPTQAVGPNASLPETKAPTNVCAEMDDIFAQSMTETSEGQAFIEAQATEADPNDPQAQDDRSSNVATSWLTFLDTFWSSHETDLRDLAADTEASEVVDAIESYMTDVPSLVNGDVPQFVDEEQARQDMLEGIEPEVNPEFTELTEQIGFSVEKISACMPTWPLLF